MTTTRQSKRVRGFYQSSRAWYWPTSKLPDEEECFVVGIYHVEPDDGCEYEFSIRLAKLTDRQFAWSLEVFDESWRAFVEFADVFERLSALGGDTTAGKVRATLTECGVVDLTKEKRSGNAVIVPVCGCPESKHLRAGLERLRSRIWEVNNDEVEDGDIDAELIAGINAALELKPPPEKKP